MASPGKKMNPQIKIMGILSLLFFGGIGLFVALPEGPARGMGLGIVSVMTIYFTFKSI
jgi:hypothetical protein